MNGAVRRAALGLLLLSGALAGPARADLAEFPVTLIVPYGQGGFTDTTARALAPLIARHLGPGARIEVVNRPNGAGEFAYAALAAAEPDGYTIGFINAPPVVAIPIERVARYATDQLDPLLLIVEDPAVWTVRADSPYPDLESLLTAARLHPGSVLVATTGVGTDDHLGVLRMQRLAEAALTPLHFPSSAAARAAMLDGRVAAVAQNLGEAVQIRGREPIRVLGIMSRERWAAAPDVPTFRELGYDVEMASLRGIAAPKGLPADVRARLVRAIRAAVDDPAFRALAEDPDGYQPLRVLSSEPFAAELRRIAEELSRLWQTDPWGGAR